MKPNTTQARPDAAELLNTMLWLYRRLPVAYGCPPFVTQAVLTLARHTGQDVSAELAEREAFTAPPNKTINTVLPFQPRGDKPA